MNKVMYSLPSCSRLYGKVVIIRGYAQSGATTCVWNQKKSSHTLATAASEDVSDLHKNVEKSWKELPGPRSLPFVGTLYKYLPGGEYYLQNRTDAEWKKLTKYGDIVKEEIFPGEVFIHLYHPDDIEQVYRSEGKYPFRGVLRATAKYREEKGGGVTDLSSSKGEEWAKVRFPVAKEMLNPKIVQSYISQQDSVAVDLVDVLKQNRNEKNQIKISQELNKYAIEAVSPVLFNERLGLMGSTLDPQLQKMFQIVSDFFEALYQCTFFWPRHKSGKSKVWKKFASGLDYMYELSTKYTKESLSSSGEKLNLMQRLQARGLEEEHAAEMGHGLFIGAIDTTSSALFCLLYNLARNPEKQQILYEAIRETFPDKTSPLTGNGVGHLTYLKACMKESFRLTPTATGSFRILDKDIVLRNYRIPAKMNLQLHNAVVSRREDIFESPNEFFPERWLRDYTPKVHPYAVLPFSHGTRNCVGKRFAEQEIMLATIRILQNFKLEHEGPPIRMKTKMLIYPLDDTLKLVDREEVSPDMSSGADVDFFLEGAKTSSYGDRT